MKDVVKGCPETDGSCVRACENVRNHHTQNVAFSEDIRLLLAQVDEGLEEVIVRSAFLLSTIFDQCQCLRNETAGLAEEVQCNRILCKQRVEQRYPTNLEVSLASSP